VAKIVARIQGGLGNQLFCYAAARRLALANNAKLVLDDVSGFVRDHKFRRSYQLGHFAIPCRTTTPLERFEPFERLTRKFLRESSLLLPFSIRPYLAQESDAFDARLLTRRVRALLYLDGLWQSEDYFIDVADQIRDDLRIDAPSDDRNRAMSAQIQSCTAVALHVRWFSQPGSVNEYNASVEYYARAVREIRTRVRNPHFFLFSDRPDDAQRKLDLDRSMLTVVDHNRGDPLAYADLWLMSQCQHFITANSTFSWWAAWLSSNPQKLVVCPRSGGVSGSWNFAGQIPTAWTQL
jgi:hypothetical protein